MRKLPRLCDAILIGLCLLVAGCGDSNYNRGYVISQSHAHIEPEPIDVDAENE